MARNNFALLRLSYKRPHFILGLPLSVRVLLFQSWTKNVPILLPLLFTVVHYTICEHHPTFFPLLPRLKPRIDQTVLILNTFWFSTEHPLHKVVLKRSPVSINYARSSCDFNHNYQNVHELNIGPGLAFSVFISPKIWNIFYFIIWSYSWRLFISAR